MFSTIASKTMWEPPSAPRSVREAREVERLVDEGRDDLAVLDEVGAIGVGRPQRDDALLCVAQQLCAQIDLQPVEPLVVHIHECESVALAAALRRQPAAPHLLREQQCNSAAHLARRPDDAHVPVAFREIHAASPPQRCEPCQARENRGERIPQRGCRWNPGGATGYNRHLMVARARDARLRITGRRPTSHAVLRVRVQSVPFPLRGVAALFRARGDRATARLPQMRGEAPAPAGPTFAATGASPEAAPGHSCGSGG